MKLPSKHTITGQVLRLMLDGKPRTKLQITEALGLHPARETTARLRDFRKDWPEGYGLNIPKITQRLGDTTLYYYHIVLDEKAEPLLEELRAERKRAAGMDVAA